MSKGALYPSIFAFFLSIGPARGQTESTPDNLVDNRFFQLGCKALAERDYSAAAANFQFTWSLPVSRANEFAQGVVASRLVESWYRNGDARTAVAWYRANETNAFAINSRLKFWTALSLLGSGHHNEAARSFRELTEDCNGEERKKMMLYHATALARSGASEQAYRVLVPDFPNPGGVHEAFLYANLAFDTNRWNEGIAHCDHILQEYSKSDPLSLLARALLLKARCLAGAGKGAAAVTLVLDLIDRSFDAMTVYLAFDVLEEIATPRENGSIREAFERWKRDEVFPNRRLAAEFYGILIDPQSNEERLIDQLEAFVYQHPDHLLAHEARMMLGTLRPNLAAILQLDESPGKVDELRRHIHFETAVKQFQDHSFSVAKESFLEISSQVEGRQREQAVFNSAISALHDGDEETFDRLENQLGTDRRIASVVHADLMFLAGLYYASQGKPRAFDLLSNFTKNYPDHASVIDANLALAELHLNQVPAQPQAARKILAELEPLKLTESRRERLDYADLWSVLLNQDFQKVREKATAFLVKRPKSKLRPEVTMLLAAEFYDKRDFREARDAFQSIARDYPKSRFSEASMFFAAKSAYRAGELKQAEEIYDEVISLKSSLSNHARHEKAILLLEKDQFDQSIELLNQVLDSNSESTGDLRAAARCDKGYALYLKALANGNDSALLTKAANEFAGIVSDTRTAKSWRYQAAVRRGQCLEMLGRETVALEIYQSLTQETETASSGASPVEEGNWLYRAGFAALNILERREDWRGAVKLAESLAEQKGPRAFEAARRAERLRLQHFVWD